MTEQDRVAFEGSALIYMDALYRTAMRMTRNPTAAEDLVQETYLRAWRSFDSFRRGSNMRAWLFRIMTNVYISNYRQASRAPIVEPLDENFERAPVAYATVSDLLAGSPEEQVLARVPHDEVRAAFEALPEQFRLAVLLADVEGFSYKEIAEVTQTPVGTVMSRLSRGRKLLQQSLLEYAQRNGLIRGGSA